MSRSPAPYQHVRATDGAGVEAGVYRVVGTSPDSVTLLRVTDGDGRRRNTGHVVTVSRSRFATDFEPAANPGDGGLSSLLRALFAMVRRALP